MEYLNNLFLIIGAQRSGTTYLYKLLEEHPEICIAKPQKPEPKFFLKEEYLKGKDFYFKKYFNHRQKQHKVFVEKSTSYYEYPVVPKRLTGDFKNTKIIFILRNPVDRALSNYFFSKNNGLETRSLEEVFIKTLPPPLYPSNISTNPFSYLERGIYINYIKMYLQYIPKKNFNIFFYDDIIKSIKSVQNIYKILGVSEDFIPASFKRKINENINQSVVPHEIILKLNSFYKEYNNLLEDFLNKTIDLKEKWK